MAGKISRWVEGMERRVHAPTQLFTQGPPAGMVILNYVETLVILSNHCGEG